MKKYKNNNDMYTMPMMPMQPIPMQPMPTQPRYPRYPNRNDEELVIVEPGRPPVDLQPDVRPPVFSPQYLQGYLKTQIGKFMRVDFLMGTGTFIDKEGVLVQVGIDHIVLRETKTDSLITCDLYSIKFVEIPS